MNLRKTNHTDPYVDPLEAATNDSANALSFFSQAAHELDDACQKLDDVMNAERQKIADALVRIDQAQAQQDVNAKVLENINDLFNIGDPATETTTN